MSIIDDVKEKNDIVDVIGQYVTLKKAGRNFKALCPFHNEKTPSFTVFPDQGTWHCYGACAEGGDVISFLQKRENIDFGEALRQLAQRAGIELTHGRPGEDEERKRLRQALTDAAAHFHYLLLRHSSAQVARDYIAKRNISAETAELFELGYSLNEWDALRTYLAGKGHSVHDLLAAGLVSQGERGTFDRFRGRLMFPIRNRNGEVTGFGARTLAGDEPKYLNSPQSVLFDKSGTLYGLDLAKDTIRAQNLAVIVEGYMDVIGAHQGGFKNVVASLGTALTEKHLGLLKRLTKRYALALDPDVAGEHATTRGLLVARESLDRKAVPVPQWTGLIDYENRLDAELLVISLPDGKDPDELIHDDPARWVELVNHAEPLVDFYFRVLTQDLDLKHARDKSTAVKRLIPIIREIGDPVQRTHYLQYLARLVQATEQTIIQEFLKAKGSTRATPVPQPVEAEKAPAQSGPKLEEYCLTLALHTPALVHRIAFLEGEYFTDAGYRALFLLLREACRDGWDRDAFRANLDPVLDSLYDRLIELEQKLPALSETEWVREIEMTAYRLRSQWDRLELARIEVMLRDQDQDRTPDDERALYERVNFLRKRKDENQKALSVRGLFGPRYLD